MIASASEDLFIDIVSHINPAIPVKQYKLLPVAWQTRDVGMASIICIILSAYVYY